MTAPQRASTAGDSSAHDRPVDAVAALLARQAETRGASVAVRFKERGLVQTRTWRELAGAYPAQRAVAATGHVLGLRWLWGALQESAESLTDASPHEPAQDQVERPLVLWIEPTLERGSARDRLLGQWLQSDAVLAVGEALDTAELDRRELAPSVLLAAASWYDRLANDVLARAGQASRARQRLIVWALEVGAAQDAPPSRRALARLLVLRPLADQLGLARTELAWVGGLPSERTRALFDALAISLRSLEQTEPSALAASDAPGAGVERARLFGESAGVHA
ncbi:MAG: fAA1 [Myxococcaceae bacterium]|nr:fAA1 [Myxococcaceae bacterium]